MVAAGHVGDDSACAERRRRRDSCVLLTLRFLLRIFSRHKNRRVLRESQRLGLPTGAGGARRIQEGLRCTVGPEAGRLDVGLGWRHHPLHPLLCLQFGLWQLVQVRRSGPDFRESLDGSMSFRFAPNSFFRPSNDASSPVLMPTPTFAKYSSAKHTDQGEFKDNQQSAFGGTQ